MNIHKKNKSDIHSKSSDKEDGVIFGVTNVFFKIESNIISYEFEILTIIVISKRKQ